MKRSVIIALLVVCFTAALSSAAAAVDGSVVVGAFYVGDSYSSHYHYTVSGELQVSEKLALFGGVITNENVTKIGARYGVGSGTYASVSFFEGAVSYWDAGVFFERALSSRVDIRAMVGLYAYVDEGTTVVAPDAVIGFRYDLDGPLALVAQFSYLVAGAGIAYEF